MELQNGIKIENFSSLLPPKKAFPSLENPLSKKPLPSFKLKADFLPKPLKKKETISVQLPNYRERKPKKEKAFHSLEKPGHPSSASQVCSFSDIRRNFIAEKPDLKDQEKKPKLKNNKTSPKASREAQTLTKGSELLQRSCSPKGNKDFFDINKLLKMAKERPVKPSDGQEESEEGRKKRVQSQKELLKSQGTGFKRNRKKESYLEPINDHARSRSLASKNLKETTLSRTASKTKNKKFATGGKLRFDNLLAKTEEWR